MPDVTDPGLGTLLAKIGAEVGGVELNVERSQESSEPIDFDRCTTGSPQ